MSGNTKYDFETMVQVAKLFYQKDMNQHDIAKEFGWSRSMVSMILSEAKDCGIIEVRIHDLTSNDKVLSGELKKRFGL
ncbi:MAG: sugar-binding transcriptional regulator, partial [Oscillospiraceae bacterium]|nr:sugar-binding transcriptional regulator [Oscillospiraceae bacterium]